MMKRFTLNNSLTLKNPAYQRCCANCQAFDRPLRLCADCKSAGRRVWYCCRDCQETDWINHREHCGSSDKTYSKLFFDGTLSSDTEDAFSLAFDEESNEDMERSLNRQRNNSSPRLAIAMNYNNTIKYTGTKRSRSPGFSDFEPAAPAPPFSFASFAPPSNANANAKASVVPQRRLKLRIRPRVATVARAPVAPKQSLFGDSFAMSSLFGDSAAQHVQKRRKLQSIFESNELTLSQSNDLNASAGTLDVDVHDVVDTSNSNHSMAYLDRMLQRNRVQMLAEQAAAHAAEHRHMYQIKTEQLDERVPSIIVPTIPNPPPMPNRRISSAGSLRAQQDQLTMDYPVATLAPPSREQAEEAAYEVAAADEEDDEESSSYTPTPRRIAHRRTRSGERMRSAKKKKLAKRLTQFVNNDQATPMVVTPKKSPAPRGRESRAKRMKRQQYGTLSAADMATLNKLGVTRVGELAPAFRAVVDQLTYLHTRRQHIVNWLAETDLFPLLSWDNVNVDEYNQPTLRLNAERAHVHAALRLLLKCEPTEWLFKRVRHATTAEGCWMFKRGQFKLLKQHAAKAVGQTA